MHNNALLIQRCKNMISIHNMAQWTKRTSKIVPVKRQDHQEHLIRKRKIVDISSMSLLTPNIKSTAE